MNARKWTRHITASALFTKEINRLFEIDDSDLYTSADNVCIHCSSQCMISD